MHVPNGWEEREFSELAELRKTKIDPKNSLVNYVCVELEHIAQETGKLLGATNTKDLASTKNVFYKGDVLFGKLRPYLRKYFYCNFNGVCSSEIWVLIAKNRCLDKYLYNIIQTHEFISTANVSSGSKMPRADWDYVAEYPILIPPFSEQQKIAQILSTWDKAIEKQEALISAKQKRKKALMQQLLTGKNRFSGFDGEWKDYHLGELFQERKETGYTDLNLLSITNKKGVILRDEVERKDTSNDDKSKYLRICPGDIGYNTMRMWQGVSALSRLDGLVSPAYTVCTPKNNIDGKFAAYLFKTIPVIHLFKRYSQGLTSDTWNLKFHHFSEIKIKIPEKIEEQQKIASVFSATDQEIDVHQKQLFALIEQKKGLMQQLLVGKKRVKLGEPVTMEGVGA